MRDFRFLVVLLKAYWHIWYHRKMWQAVCNCQWILKGEVSLYRWPSVWLVWNQLHHCWQFCFYLQNRLIQTSQTGQWYSDTSPFSIPCIGLAYPSYWKLIRRSSKLSKTFWNARKSLFSENALEIAHVKKP